MAGAWQGNRRRLVRYLLIAAAVIVVVEIVSFLALDRSNPPVQAEPNWDSPRTRELIVNACYDCHSNETTWPWYSAIAPVSWLTYRDVAEGRNTLNFSEWSGSRKALEVAEVVAEGEMPPSYYTIMHPKAKLSDEEKLELIQGWQATLAQTSGLDMSGGD